MVQAGDWVRFTALPPGFDQWEPSEATQIFRHCLGRVYRVAEIDIQGLCVLDVSRDIDPVFGDFMNDIRVEEECLEVIAQPDECQGLTSTVGSQCVQFCERPRQVDAVQCQFVLYG